MNNMKKVQKQEQEPMKCSYCGILDTKMMINYSWADRNIIIKVCWDCGLRGLQRAFKKRWWEKLLRR